MGSIQPADEADVCYICLQEACQDFPVIRPCACRFGSVHQTCLARWQLQSAGTEEESTCRFCKQTLPSWKAAFSDFTGSHTVPVMSIQFQGQNYWLEVKPGNGGVEQFKEDVRRLLGLTAEQAFDITFECRGPDDSKMELKGLHAYDAAVYCASLTAARRVSRSGEECNSKSSQWPPSSSSSTSGGSGSLARSSVDSGATTPSSSSAAARRSRLSSSSSSGGSSSSLLLESSCTTPAATLAAGDIASAETGLLQPISSISSTSSMHSLAFTWQPAWARLVTKVLASLRLLWQPPDDLMEFC